MGNKFESIAKMNITGIVADYSRNINEMVTKDFAFLSFGSIRVHCILPNTKPEPYLITMHILDYSYFHTKLLSIKARLNNSRIDCGEMLLNGAEDKYNAIINIGGHDAQIDIEIREHPLYVYGVTITKL